MARPRSIDADVVQTFHCSYAMRAAIERAALVASHGNNSKFIRQNLERACRQELGEDRWRQLEAAANPELRRELLSKYLARTNEMRKARTHNIEATTGTQNKVQIWLHEYASDFTGEMRRPDVDLATAVALVEAADTMLKIARVLARDKIEKSAIRLLQRLVAKFPDSLVSELNAAILNRYASLLSEK